MPFTCSHCHRTSHSERDAAEEYCGSCHISSTDIRTFRSISSVRASFDVVGVEEGVVYLTDRTGADTETPTITNDAEQVVKFMHFAHPRHRIVYKDSDGHWGELRHDAGFFVEFKAAPVPGDPAIVERAAA